VVEKLVNEVAGGIAATIMGKDGIALSIFKAEKVTIDVEVLGIEYANLLSEVSRASATIGSGDVQEITLLTDQYCTLLKSLNPEYFMALILAPAGNVGKGRFLMRINTPKNSKRDVNKGMRDET